jgi:CheY-like chemotaxis protein
MCTHPFGVMIVSDDGADLETIANGLLSLDPPPCVVACRTAAEALEALHTQPELSSATMPFVILVEVDLPLVSGLEFVACMQCDASLSRIPVFVLTESSSDREQFAAHDLKVAGYLQKPVAYVESTTIAARLAAYMRSGNSSQGLRQAVHGRARMACLPRKVTRAAKLPESQRRSIATGAG